MRRRRWSQWGALLVGVLSPGASLEASAARALAYPASWPARVPLICSTLPRTYADLPFAVEDAGQRLSRTTLSALLQLASVEAAAAAHEAHTITLSVNEQGHVAAVQEGGALEEIPGGRCERRAARATLAPRTLSTTSPSGGALTHLQRMGIRTMQPLLYSTPIGDLIVALRVIRRERRYETFGYPAIEEYWLWYRQVPRGD